MFRNLSLAVILCPLLILAACNEAPFEAERGDLQQADLAAQFDKRGPGEMPLGAQLAQLRAATAKYHDVERAMEDGFNTLPGEAGECVAIPLGGMGYHYVNLGNAGSADDLSIEKPQALLYEPMKNGRKRLVGGEFIVFWGPGEDKGPQPTLFGQHFHESPHVGPFGAWTLHVWVWRNNPLGMFADWNPNVSCEYAS